MEEAVKSSVQTLAEAPWSTPHKIGFRLAFCYLFLYLFPLSGTFAWMWWSKLPAAYESIWHKIVPWVGAHVLHLSYAITIFPEVNGGSDTTYDYVKSFSFVLLAALATIVWSILDRNRPAYVKLDQWLRVYVRLVLASALLSYGMDKVIPLQMPPPSLITLMEPFGDLTPYRLSWGFIGASGSYETFAGIAEVLGGILLLIPGTATLGALVGLGALTNVFMLNVCYGIPVKFWALHLILFSLFLLLPQTRRLIDLFVFNRGAAPEPQPPLSERRWLNQLVWGVQWFGAIFLIVSGISQGISFHHQVEKMTQTDPLYGIWSVEEFTVGGQVRPPLLTDNLRWQRVIFSSPNTMAVQEMNGQYSPYALITDNRKSTLSIAPVDASAASSPWWSEWHTESAALDPASSYWRSHVYGELNYNQSQPDSVVVEGQLHGHQVHMTLKKENRQFVLKTLGFRWINDEYDFYNERLLK
jgi:uncharacterized membrane protein YphA (DoxX/SURF4 family)